MGIDFDENGKNEEYEADENEPTGEPGDEGRTTPRVVPAIVAAPVLAGNVNDLLRGIMGPPAAPAAEPQTAEEALQVSEDTYMNEVEKRLELASFYRILLKDSLFENTSEAARVVDFEVRGFVRERLGALMGIDGGGKKAPLFSPEQMEVLTLLAEMTPAQAGALAMIAGKVLGNVTTAAATPPVRRPPPAQPEPAKVAPKPAPKIPTIAKRAGPATNTALSAPQPTQEQQRPGPGRPPGSKGKPRQVDKIQAVRKHPDGTEEPLFNVKTGEPVMVAVKRPAQRPPDALPFPNEAQMSQVTAIQAGDRAAMLERNPEVQKALRGLANSQ